jgi:hypothetical protein
MGYLRPDKKNILRMRVKRRNKMAVSIVILIVAALLSLISGCRGGNTPRPKPLVVGFVNLDALMEANPEYARVRELDRQITAIKAQSEREIKAPNELLFSALGSSLPQGPSSELGYPEEAFIKRLNGSNASFEDRLQQRLTSANAASFQFDKEDIRAAALKSFSKEHRAMLQSQDESLVKITERNADKLNRLDLQISALSADASPLAPRTAPEGYWAQLLAKKQEEKKLLLKDVDNQIDQQFAVQQAQNLALRDRVDADAARRIADAEAKLGADYEERLAGYKKLLTDRRDSVLETAREFDRQTMTALETESTAQLQMASQKKGNFSRSSMDQEWGADLANTVKRLQQQRARELRLVKEHSERLALDASSRFGLKIVGWAPSAGRRDLTSVILKESARLK